MGTSHRGRTRCYVEPRGKKWRLNYTVNGTRLRAPVLIESEDIAYKVASLITEALVLDPESDPWPDIEPFALRAAGRQDEPQAQKPASPLKAKGSMTIAQWYEIWVATRVWPAVRESRARDYRKLWRLFLKDEFGHLKLNQLTVHHITAFRDRLIAEGRARTYVSTIIRSGFKPMIRDALIKEIITRNPFDNEAWRTWPESFDIEDVEESSKADPFTSAEKAKLVKQIMDKEWPRNPHFAGFLMFLLTIGARPSEAAGLQWRDIDLTTKVARIERSYSCGRYGPPKTKRSKRPVVLSDELVQLLRQLQPAICIPEAPVFRNQRNKPFTVAATSIPWYRVQRAAGVRGRGIYCLKDTFVSLAREAGCSWVWIEQQTGVRESTLVQHYDKRNPDSLVNEFDKVKALEQPQPHGALPHRKEVAKAS